MIFCGSGATAAINKLIDVLNLRLPAELDARCQLSAQLPEAERPVVFIGPYEHHSNELPWRESIAELEVIPLDAQGGIDQRALASALGRHAHRSLLIGSFSAAGPYVAIDMNGDDPLDAVFLSPHKFVGGPGPPVSWWPKARCFATGCRPWWNPFAPAWFSLCNRLWAPTPSRAVNRHWPSAP